MKTIMKALYARSGAELMKVSAKFTSLPKPYKRQNQENRKLRKWYLLTSKG